MTDRFIKYLQKQVTEHLKYSTWAKSTSTQPCTHTHTHTHTHTYTHMSTHTCTYTHTHLYVLTKHLICAIKTCEKEEHTHTYTHTHIYTRMQAHMHTHTLTPYLLAMHLICGHQILWERELTTLVDFIHLVLISMPCDSYHKLFRSLLWCLCFFLFFFFLSASCYHVMLIECC